jgi:hypothetical protein
MKNDAIHFPKGPHLNVRRQMSAGRFAFTTIFAVFGVVYWTAPANAGVDLVPHRAIYGMSLYSAERGAGVTGAGGTMVYGFRDSCDAWSSETNVKLRLIYSEGDQVETEWSFASWEAKNGKSYQFRTRQARDGVTVEELKGRVERDGPKAAAVALFSKPEDKEIELSKDTLFPSRHLIDLLEAGAAGKSIFSRTVFDGASLDNPYIISAVRGQRSPADAVSKAAKADELIAAAGLKSEKLSHYRLAFFPRSSREAVPDFELGVDYRPDGIARFIRQDYGDFVIDLFLQNIELSERPRC